MYKLAYERGIESAKIAFLGAAAGGALGTLGTPYLASKAGLTDPRHLILASLLGGAAGGAGGAMLESDKSEHSPMGAAIGAPVGASVGAPVGGVLGMAGGSMIPVNSGNAFNDSIARMGLMAATGLLGAGVGGGIGGGVGAGVGSELAK